VADPQRNGRIGKVFELRKPSFRRDMERFLHLSDFFQSQPKPHFESLIPGTHANYRLFQIPVLIFIYCKKENQSQHDMIHFKAHKL